MSVQPHYQYNPRFLLCLWKRLYLMNPCHPILLQVSPALCHWTETFKNREPRILSWVHLHICHHHVWSKGFFFSQTCVCAVLDSFIFLACLSLLLMALWQQSFLCVWFTASDVLAVDILLFSIMSAATSVAVQISSHNVQAIDISFTRSHKVMLGT